MHVDKARDNRLAFGINRSCISGDSDRATWANRVNAISLDDNNSVLNRRSPGAVPNLRSVNHDSNRLGRGCRRLNGFLGAGRKQQFQQEY
jgi:hypothetical protein